MKRIRRTTLITIFCLAVLGGLGLARKFSFEPQTWFAAMLPIVFLLRLKNITSLLILVAAGLCVGLWRGNVYMQHVHQLNGLSGKKVTITAKATSDAVYSSRSQIEFTANNANFHGRFLKGSFKISGFGVPMIYRGDLVQISGKLYPMRGSNQARIAYAQLTIINADISTINNLTRHFDAGMQSALPEPMASFGLGLLIGQRTTLPQDVLSALTAVGLVHIVAVSGYNLTILIRAVGRLKLESKYQKLLLSLALILVFVLVTGFSASIVRAALVSVLSLWGWYYGRRLRPVLLIAFAAALTAMWNPFYIWSDLGWYLSFLAFFGVLVIAPIVSARLFRRPPKMLTLVVIETLSAEVMTLPLILMTFSQLSIIALIANALIVPLVPLAMFLSALAAAAGAIVPQIAGWIALPARLLLTYMLDIVRLLANLPSVLVHKSINAEYMIAIYGLILLITIVAYHKLSRPKHLIQEKINLTL